ncbi:MAG: squalene--hopene cyclase [Planctomycetota bacterium]|jgi:squalene-hopene/tetraprenyl-beta-curcumene cyclase
MAANEEFVSTTPDAGPVGFSNLINTRALPLIGAGAPKPPAPPANAATYVAAHTRGLHDPAAPTASTIAAPSVDALANIDAVIAKARAKLESMRVAPESYWVGLLEADVTLNAEYLMFMRLIDRWDADKAAKLAAWIRHKQLEDGSWAIFEGGDGDLSATIEAYFGLKLSGATQDEPALVKAREFILAHGGAMKARSLTKIFLALFGEFSWKGLPEIPVEWMFLPRISAFNIYEFACWARAYTVPLMVLNAKRHVCTLPPEQGIDELYCEPAGERDFTIVCDSAFFSWTGLFAQVDKVLKLIERSPVKWILEHQDEPGDWGGIFPAMMNSVLALLALGHSIDEPVLRKGCESLERLAVRETVDGTDMMWMQPCVSPVWDTAWAVLALMSSGSTEADAAVNDSCRWLESRQIRRPGDWAVKAPGVEPGGWCFQFANDFYPDIDDSSVVLMALTHRSDASDASSETFARGFRWVLALQNDDGGWGAFERHVDNPIYNKLLFNDKQNMLDPSTADVTARVVEMMGVMGVRTDPLLGMDGPLERGLTFLRREQEPDGSWWGRWGANHVYGTWSVLVALHACDIPKNDPAIRKAVAWLESIQNPDGGFGESLRSYESAEWRGKGASTPSQTAWALMGLIAAGEAGGTAAQKAATWLTTAQAADGDFIEPEWTGTGFPAAFYLRYHMYRLYFPLMALGRYRAAIHGATAAPAE